MSADYIKPTVLALVVCDEVIEDLTTRKKSLIGLFNNIHAQNFPSIHTQLVVFIAMTGQGVAPIRLELVHAEDVTEESKPILRLEQAEFRFKDPNTIVDLVFKFNGVPFPRPGLYHFRVMSGNELLSERDFRVNHISDDDTPREGQ